MQIFLNIILPIITVLLGGTNIVQLVNNRQLRRKMAAEGEQAEIQSLQLIINGNVAEIKRLQERLDDAEKRYESLWGKYMNVQQQIKKLQETINLTNRVARMRPGQNKEVTLWQ